MENSGNGDVVSAKFHEEETTKQQAEPNRKEKALAEAVALLILQKKLRRSWEAESFRGEEDENSCRHRRGRRKRSKAFQGLRGDPALRASLPPLADNRGGYRARNQTLSESEKKEIVERFTSDGISDLPVNVAHAKLMDSGIYLASASTCVRVMNGYYRKMNRAVSQGVRTKCGAGT